MSNEELAKRYYERWEALAERHGSLLRDRERFLRLIRDPVFVAENNQLFLDTTCFFDLINFPPSLDGDACRVVEKYLAAFEAFVEKWKTRPVSIWLFLDDHEVIRRSLEMLWDSRGKEENVSIYPWTTEQDLGDEFSRIRRRTQRDKKRLSRSDMKRLAESFRIKALRDAGWRMGDIIAYLTQDASLAQGIRDLIRSGLSLSQAEKIAERDLPEPEEPEYDTIRKRVDAAEEVLAWFEREYFEERSRATKKRR